MVVVVVVGATHALARAKGDYGGWAWPGAAVSRQCPSEDSVGRA